MIKKTLHILTIISGIVIFLFPSQSDAADYGRHLSLSERNRICQELKASRQQNSQKQQNESLGGGIIPDSVLSSVYNTTRQISDSVSLVLVLGHALTCNAVHANKQEIKVLGLRLFSYPNIPVWICGAIIYFVGFMLTLSVTFYLVDIAFKLGFAVIMLPIGVALWPFPPTKNKLTILISIILKNAAVFAFLAMTVAYALNLIGEAGGGLESIFERIDNNETDTITKDFSLFSSNFLIVLFALVYGMKLIGSTITDYVDKFFPDKAFGKGQGASPIHGSMTQAMDFAKKKVAAPVASFAGDVAKTQIGRATVATGKLLSGGYNQQFKRAAHYATHLDETMSKGVQVLGNTAGRAVGGAGKFLNKAVMGTAGRIALGNNARKALQEKLDAQIDKGVGKINQFANNAAAKIHTPAPDDENDTAGQGADTANNAPSKKDNAIHKAYNKTINAFDKAQQRVDNLKNRINRPVDNFKQKMYQRIDDAFGKKQNDSKVVSAGKTLTRGVLKTPVALASGIAKTPTNIVAGVAKAPIKVVETATKILYVPNSAKAVGNVLMRVGDKMQRNKKPAGWKPFAEESESEREERLRREQEEKARDIKTWE